MQKYSLVGLVSLSLCIPFSGFAESEIKTDEIVVTATRSAQTADETLASVVVITRQDIEGTQSETLVDLLQHYAGIDILRSGGPGQQTSLFMRGTNSDHTLVLIDGMPVSSATTGSFQWETLPLNDIEKIEIVRGPRSALYGSEAIGGVIQVFTRNNSKTSAELLAGSFGTYGANLSGSYGTHGKIRMNASHKQSDGISATNSSNFSHDPDKDGYVQQSFGIGLNTKISDASTADVFAKHSTLANDFDSGTSDTRELLLRGKLDYAPSAHSAYRLTGGVYNNVLDTEGSSSITTRRYTLGFQRDRQLTNEAMLTVGLDYRKDTGTNIDTFSSITVFDQSTDNSAGYVHWNHRQGKRTLELSGRADVHSEFGSHVTGQAAWGRSIGNGKNLYASVGTGFKAPDLNELFHPGYDSSAWIPGCNPCYAGNPALKPEESSNIEFGIKSGKGTNKSTTSLFYNRINNLIDYQGANYQAINIARAVAYGLEYSRSYQLSNWLFDTQFTVQRATDDATGNALLRRPNEKISIRGTRQLENNASLMLELFASNGHEDYGITLPAYTTINAAYSHQLAPNWRLSARINNLTDARYEVVSGYNTLPRSFLVNLRYQATR